MAVVSSVVVVVVICGGHDISWDDSSVRIENSKRRDLRTYERTNRRTDGTDGRRDGEREGRTNEGRDRRVDDPLIEIQSRI